MKGEKWKAAIAVAERFDGIDVIYCLSFAHGLMKVGTSSAMRERLKQYDNHGLLSPLLDWIVIVPVEIHQFHAEKKAIAMFDKHCQRKGREVFESPGKTFAKKVLHWSSVAHKVESTAPAIVYSPRLSDAMKSMGGNRAFSDRFGFNPSTVAAWVARNRVPARVMVDNKPVARALKRAGYRRGGE